MVIAGVCLIARSRDRGPPRAASVRGSPRRSAVVGGRAGTSPPGRRVCDCVRRLAFFSLGVREAHARSAAVPAAGVASRGALAEL